MRKKIIIGLAVMNGLIALALFAVPAKTQIIPNGIWDCCEYDQGGEGYCCQNCCWLVPDCNEHSDCRDASPS